MEALKLSDRSLRWCHRVLLTVCIFLDVTVFTSSLPSTDTLGQTWPQLDMAEAFSAKMLYWFEDFFTGTWGRKSHSEYSVDYSWNILAVINHFSLDKQSEQYMFFTDIRNILYFFSKWEKWGQK